MLSRSRSTRTGSFGLRAGPYLWLCAQILLAARAQANPLATIFSFDGERGASPRSAPLVTSQGALAGTTRQGGRARQGALYELAPPDDGGAHAHLLLLQGTKDRRGSFPEAPLLELPDGTLVGTTTTGGRLDQGTVFAEVPAGGTDLRSARSWTEHLVASLGGADGNRPVGRLAVDATGMLYGAAASGGAYGKGCVFSLSPPATGSLLRKLDVLHDFRAGEGETPNAGLAVGAGGTLYGTTSVGGRYGYGTVFSLHPSAPGQPWIMTVLHDFAGPDGAYPQADLILDFAGALFGSTTAGGHDGDGTVFQLLPPSGARGWTEAVLHSFVRADSGARPSGALVLDGKGVLYGTAAGGGACDDCGTVFALAPTAQRRWTLQLLHRFDSGGAKGLQPVGLAMAPDGTLYGATAFGGGADAGTIFRIAP